MASARDELVPVNADGRSLWLLAEDMDALVATKIEPDIVRLLPNFDSYLLAHKTKTTSSTRTITTDIPQRRLDRAGHTHKRLCSRHLVIPTKKQSHSNRTGTFRAP